MPDFEFEFNQQDKELVISQEAGNFNSSAQFENYMRLTIYPTEAINNIVTLEDETKGVNGQAIFYSTPQIGNPFSINTSPFGAGLDEFNVKQIGTSDLNDFKIYSGEGNSVTANIYIKPNEIFNEFELPQGDYKLQIDFLRQLNPSSEDIYPFIIKQISTSRKEVRLKLLNPNGELSPIENNSSTIDTITEALNRKLGTSNISTPLNKYQFGYVLNIGTGDHIRIMNYQFDKVTDGKDNQSLILKLYEPLPTNVGNLSMVTLEEEVLTTLTQDIFYFSDVPDVFFGDGLLPDAQENWINPDGNDIGFENYDELSGSLDSLTLDNLISSSEYNYPNLNTDFNEFANHTFFGSAKKKLENFNTKITTIQSYYSDISSSLSISSSINGDSTFVIQNRKNLFDKINKEIKTFSPYERFLYYDAQSESTASAPALKNYAHTNRAPVGNDDLVVLNNHDGFNVVYQHSTDPSLNPRVDSTIDLFSNTYRVQEKPFFNYSGSIYLSFVLKGDAIISAGGSTGLKWDKIGQRDNINGLRIPLPKSVVYQNSLQVPAITGSEYRRFIYQTSQSYWIPNQGIDFADLPSEIGGEGFVSDNSITILNESVKTGSYKIKDSTGRYPTTVVTQSGAPFKGSCMPAGELFRIYFQGDLGEVTSSFMTDVKVTLQNPTNVLPFDNVYKTTSTEWTSWYNDMLTKAENFDTDNIHSFENNLPLYIQESSDYNDMKGFLNLQGEQYDLIRNHIDSMGTLHKRGYKKTDSPPDNTLPMLLNNMGWEAINPFSGSLENTLGNYLTSVTSIDDIKNNTWRKTLNNLIYIYKSKGTKNSVRALLNTYGYPPDVLQFQEFGGSTEESNPRVFLNTPPSSSGVDLDLSRVSGSFSFNTDRKILHNYRFGSKDNRILNLDWWMNGANLNTIQFVYKHTNTTQTQTILQSSGSGTLAATGSLQVLSDDPTDFDGTLLRITSSDGTGKTYVFDDDSDGISGTLDGDGRVRIQINGASNNDEIASEISKSISSTNGHAGKIEVVDYISFLTNTGQNFITSDGDTLLANSSGSVFLTQLTASVDGNRLITTTAPSMSVSGFIGGSDVQHLWDLNLIPSSDGISSSFEFRLSNTPHASASISSSAVSMSTNYSNMSDGQLWNVMLQRMSSSVSGSGTNEYRLHSSLQENQFIKTYNYVTMSVSGGLSIDSNYYANQNWIATGSRNPSTNQNLIVGGTLTGSLSEIKGWATALSTSKFRQHTLNKFSTVGNTINSHKDELVYHFKLNENYGLETESTSSVSHAISSSTQNMTIFDSSPTINYSNYNFTKKASIFFTGSVYNFDYVDKNTLTLQDNISKRNDNTILINPRKNIVSDLSPIQSSVKPLTQENSKPLFKTSPKLELYRSPQTFVDNFILDNLSGFNLEKLYGNPINYYSQSYDEFDTFRENFFNAHPIEVDVNKFIRAHESMFNSSIAEGIKSLVPARSTFSDRNSNFGVEIKPTILEKQKYEHEKHSVEVNPNTITGSINPVVSSLTSEYIRPKSGSVSINITNTTTYEQPKTGSISVNVTNTTTYERPKSGSLSPLPSFSGSTVVLPHSGSIDYASHANKSFVNIHDNWGRGVNDVYFINYFNTGSTNATDKYNTYHIDTRFVFHAIGDNEFYSGSKSSNFSNPKNFHNRLMIDTGVHADVSYESLIGGANTNQTGRMMGKTRYFRTGSDGTITLPENHITKFSQPFKEQMINGTQNENPGTLNVRYEDYSSASFYRVKVTGGENQIKVGSGNPTKGSNNKIIYS